MIITLNTLFVIIFYRFYLTFSVSPSQYPTQSPILFPTFAPVPYSIVDISVAGSYSFIIPTGVQYLVVDLYGAQGQDVPKTTAQSYGGNGAHVRMTVTKFRPSQTMFVTVGSRGGTYGNPGTVTFGSSNCPLGAGGGGGYSALLDSNNVIIGLAGGGGGGGDGNYLSRLISSNQVILLL